MGRSSFILGVCGGSCSGKTSFAQALVKRLGADRAKILYQDSYYIDQSARFKEDGDVNFDHPDAIDFELLGRHLDALKNGESVEVPIYDFVTHKRLSASETLDPCDVVILDGTLILSQSAIVKRLSDSLFIDCPEDLRLARRKKRDVVERGRTPQGVVKQFELHVKPMHDSFVQPSMGKAQWVLYDGPGFRDSVESYVNQYLERGVL
jgi:uridine kinase